MAIEKDFNLPTTGASIRYWRVTQTVLNHAGQTVDVYVGGYVSEEARQQGKDPATTMFFRFKADELEGGALHSITTGEVYDLVLGRVNKPVVLPNGQPGEPHILAGAVST
jgi:hypothetical protein